MIVLQSFIIDFLFSIDMGGMFEMFCKKYENEIIFLSIIHISSFATVFLTYVSSLIISSPLS